MRKKDWRKRRMDHRMGGMVGVWKSRRMDGLVGVWKSHRRDGFEDE